MVHCGIRNDRRILIRGDFYFHSRLGGGHPVFLHADGPRIFTGVFPDSQHIIAVVLQVEPDIHLYLPGGEVWILVVQNRSFLLSIVANDRSFF